MNSFIKQTAKDYDMDYNTVKSIYNRFYNDGAYLFYAQLELYVSNRYLQDN